MSLRRRALFLAGLFVAVSCSDAGSPLEPEGPRRPTGPGTRPEEVVQALTCTVSVDNPEMQCAADPGTSGGLGNVVIIGGSNGLNVLLTKIGHNFDADSMWFDVTLENRTGQTLGTVDGTTVDVDSIRIFFEADPVPMAGGDVTVGHPTGAEPYTTGAPQPYYEYPGFLVDQATSPARRWHFNLDEGATRFTFTVLVRARVQYPQGWVEITPDDPTIEVGGLDSLTARVRNRFGRHLPDGVTWSTTNAGVVTVNALTDTTAEITGAGEGTAYVKAVSTVDGVRRDSVLVTVNNMPVVTQDSIDGLMNVTDSIPAPRLQNNVTDASATPVPGTYATSAGGTATVTSGGALVYRAAAGFAGKDTVTYPVSDGAWTVYGKMVVQVAPSNYWYVQAGASGDGRDRSPFGTLAAAVAAAATADSILVLANGVTALDGAATLKNQQAVIGQGIPASITTELNGHTVTILAAGSAPGLTHTAAGATLTLAQDNVVRGVGITAAAGPAITGTGFGTLYVRNVGVNPAGPALQLSTGALDAVFDVLSSTGSGTTGVSLTDVTGTLTGTGGAIGSAMGTAFHVSGGSADISYGGSISNAAGSAVTVTGRTGGTLTLSGTISDTGAGISVTGNTGGTIEFTGSSKSIGTGTGAAVSLATNTGATITFGGGGLAIATTSGAAFTATGGGTVSVTGGGNSITTTTGTALNLNGVSTGAAGASFVSISADGAANGIVLANLTGAGVQVTGTGTTAGSGGTIQNTTGHAVSLATLAGADSVRLQYMNVSGGTGGNAGIFGSDFGTLRVLGLSVGTTGGPALSLSTGTLNGGFSSLGSANSGSSGVILTSVGGAFTAAAGSIGNAASTGFAVAGGTVGATYQGGISQGANNAPLVAVSGGHTGTLGFDTGTLSATAGTGLSFNDADGTYAFSGTTGLNGGDAGIDITNGSAGTFTFGTGTSVTNPTGSAFTVYGSSPTVSYSGSLTKNNAGLLVEIGEQPGGSVTFQTGTLSASAGDGIHLANADGSVLFTGTTTLSGGSPRVLVNNGSDGVFDFGVNTSVTTTTGTALDVDMGAGGGTPALVYRGSLNSSAGRVASIQRVSGDSVMIVGAVGSGNSGSPTGLGILVQSNTGGKIGFNGTSKQLYTGINPAVTLASNSGAQVEFRGGGLAVTTTTGAGITASGGGTVIATGAGNTVSTSTGTPVSLNGMATGVDGVVLAGVSTTGAVNGVLLTNVTGTGVGVFGGTITNTTGASLAISGGSAGLDYRGTVNQGSAGAALLNVTGGHTGAVSVPSGTLTATNGTGLQFDNADGTYTFGGTVTLNGGDAGIDVLNGSGGTFTFGTGVAITSPSGVALNVSNSGPTLSMAGPITHNAGRAVSLVSVGGTVGVSGNVSGSGPSASGILVQTSSAAVTFSGTSKSLSTQGNTAVTLTSNTGSVLFSGGGLAITTTSGAGFNATGGGTVVVSGSNNTVASTGGGRTVNIQNTGIGAANVTFRSVTGTGAASGVRVENTGTQGGFKITGDGSTASSGGIITMNAVTAADSAAYTLTNTANVSLEFVRVEVTTGNGAGGIAAGNLSGTNLVRNSVFDYNQTPPAAVPLHNAYAMYFAQTNTNGTITIDGSSVNGTRAGSSAGVLSARGTSVVTFNVIDSNTGDGFQSLFTDLFGSAWVVASGDGGSSSAVVNLTVRDSRFTNAAPNGTNNLEMGVSSNATMNYKVKDNLFQNVANASCICGIVNVNTSDAGVFGSNTAMDSIVGNTITNTGIGSAVTDLGYIPMRIAFDNSTATTNRVVIANNVITDSWRQGILLSTRQNSTGHFKVINNTVGTAALPVGQSNRRGIETDLQQGSVMNLEMTGNNVTGAGTFDASASVGLRVGTDVSGSATLNATVVGNTIRSTNPGNNGRFRAESSATSPGTLCLDLRTNNLEDNARLYTLTQSGGTFRVEGAGSGAVTNAAIQAANSAGAGNVSGTVNFNNGANCTQPPI